MATTSELESNLHDSVDCCRKLRVDFNAWKKMVSFDWSNNTGAIDVKMDRSRGKRGKIIF